MVEQIRAPNSSSGVYVQIPVVTPVYLSKTLPYNCFSPPRGKWVPVRAEMVLVIDLASCATYLLHRLYTPQGAEMV